MIFPPEIWEHIFLYADPVALTNLKTVCKCWNEIIDKILKENDHWYNKCKTDIPEYLWSSLCEKLNPSKFYTNLHESLDADTWMAMYRLWVRCRNLVKYDIATECIEPFPKYRNKEHITCMTVSENLLAIGTSEGYICVYDVSNLNGHPIYRADHVEYVRNVQFLRDDTNIVAVSSSINNHVHFWDIKSRKLIDKKRGKLICTSYSYCYTAMNNVIVIEGSVPRTIYEFGLDNIVAIGADNDKVLFYTERGHYVKLNPAIDRENYTYRCIKPPNIKIRRYYIFKPDIAVCITEFGYLGFLIRGEEWKLYNVLSVLHGTPTTVLVYAHLLVLGLDSGNVHIYYVKDFETLDFSSAQSKKITLDSKPVISLDILVHLEEYLMVAYSTKIYIVKFL